MDNQDIVANPLATITDYRKGYYEANKDKIKARNLERYHSSKELRATQMKDYHLRNRVSILEKKNEKVECHCGGKYTRGNQSKHFKSKKHMTYLEVQ